MKPTQEQIIAWAREAGFYGSEILGDHEYDVVGLISDLERFSALAYEAGRKEENEACAGLMLKAMHVLEEAQAYTGCETWSPSMTEECKQVEEALRNYMYDRLAEKHADNMRKDVKAMADWVKAETDAIRARREQ